eukprot:SAG11_NODE_2201_length_3695_cov_8.582870_1_plen_165_part_00
MKRSAGLALVSTSRITTLSSLTCSLTYQKAFGIGILAGVTGRSMAHRRALSRRFWPPAPLKTPKPPCRQQAIKPLDFAVELRARRLNCRLLCSPQRIDVKHPRHRDRRIARGPSGGSAHVLTGEHSPITTGPNSRQCLEAPHDRLRSHVISDIKRNCDQVAINI